MEMQIIAISRLLDDSILSIKHKRLAGCQTFPIRDYVDKCYGYAIFLWQHRDWNTTSHGS
ncbi:hypothetical protein PHSC3_000680 [Chlamydiales bacterium STE3]|nr:hypothetical protein PHSC3_000680 [Chlamydiales bacterium STE3]